MHCIDYFLFLLISFFIYITGWQLYVSDIMLLLVKYNYRIRLANWVSFIAAILCLLCLTHDILRADVEAFSLGSLLCLISAIVVEWLLAKMNPHKLLISVAIRFIVVFVLGISFLLIEWNLFFPFAILGLYARNTPFGVVHKNDFLLLNFVTHQSEMNKCMLGDDEALSASFAYNLPSFSSAGSLACTFKQIERFDVRDYGIFPNRKDDVLQRVQQLVNEVGIKGGGIIYFPKGEYQFNKDSNQTGFLQINYSNITLEGEVDSNNKPLSVFLNCNKTLYGKKNPWLSPFFITTGELLQKSNMFWGLQFKKKKNLFTRSESLADPGSDGNILTPSFASNIIRNSLKGDSVIYVEDTSLIEGSKYILLGLYNTSTDGNLIKELLGVDKLRSEWKTALRAGDEEAPSYQWLVEVDSILDKHAVRLIQPLRRDCLMKFSPAVFVVEMLENVTIKNLKIESLWNGLFRHHGFPLYYSISQSQEMDYGWNGINMKRVAHGLISNVVFEDFTNPLYVMDSRNVTVEKVIFQGYDGHQGIKVYEHACDNLFKDITFYNHYADMMGGEGNAYGNVFSNISYENPCFKPVDFDFHGFSEGPMSPPSCNLFENISGFRYIKAAGAIYNQPACAKENVWWNIESEGEKYGSNLFISLPYWPKGDIRKKISALRYSLVLCIQKGKLNIPGIKENYMRRLSEMEEIAISPDYHHLLFSSSLLVGYKTKAHVKQHLDQTVQILSKDKFVSPTSLYWHQKEMAKS